MVSASLFAVAALVAAGSAAPTETRTFSIKQVPLNKGWRLNGVQKTAQVYRKFGKEMPAALSAAAATQTGTVTATPSDQYDDEYTCPVSVGGQTLQLDFDTGSADLWVFSSLQSAAQRSGHAYYTPGSSAKRLSGYTWDISYGDGSGASGVVYDDKVVIGGATASTQAVEAATSVSSEFQQDTASDGLVGLAFSSINTVEPQQQQTFFANIQSTLPQPLFAAALNYHAAGQYDFGYIDSSKYTGSITYVPVNTANGFWEFTSSGYAVGSGAFKSSSIDAIADTGTTLLYVPNAVVKAYYAKVAGAQNSNTYGGYVFPCSATLPSLTLGVGSYHAVIPGNYLNYSPVETGSSTCYGGVQSNTGIGFSIYGDVFLKSQYVVFYGGNSPKLGVAAK